MKTVPKCTRCKLSKTRRNIVWGAGCETPPVPVMLLTESPNQQEDRQGKPFVGKTNAEFYKVLGSAGIPLDKIHFSNIVKCHVPKNGSPPAECIQACSCWLQMEIERLRPSVIATVGRIATREFLGDVNMEAVHGRAFYTEYSGKSCVVVPVYNPAAGFHRDGIMHNVRIDFKFLAKVLVGEVAPEPALGTVSDEPVDYYEVTKLEQLETDLNSDLIAIDTETIEHPDGTITPWCLTYSTRSHAAGLIKATNTNLLQKLGEHIGRPDVTTLMHNSLFDLGVLAQMDLEPTKVIDTMIAAYLLQNEPLSLKALASRYCHMTMRNYTEIVGDVSHKEAMQYLFRVYQERWPDPPEVLEWVKDIPKVRKPQNLSKRVARILMDEATKGVNPRERWENIKSEEGRGMAEKRLGRMVMGNLGQIPFSEALQYACADADATFRLYPVLWKKLKTYEGLTGAFWDDMGIIPMVHDMQQVGIQAVSEHFKTLSKRFEARMDELDRELTRETGATINTASNESVGHLLFKVEKLKPVKKTPSGAPSTDADVLAALAGQGSKAAQIIRDWREQNKLLTTYSRPLPNFIQPDGRVHPNIRLTGTATGRLSTHDPNLMAQPIRSSDGRTIRDGFVAGPGRLLLSCDYSQIELRILAHVSQDPTMLEVFSKSQDIHSRTASEIFGVPIDRLDKYKHRTPAKRVNFGIPYGTTEVGLSSTLVADGADPEVWTVKRCKEFIDEWFTLYPNVKKFMEGVQQHARRFGYVTDMWGRTRLTPGVRASDQYVIEKTLREACNMPIQSGAQGVIKKAMAKLNPVYRDFRAQGYWCWPLLQIHDDILSEVDADLLPELVPIVVSIMEGAVELSIPTPVEPEIGVSWGTKYPYSEDRIIEVLNTRSVKQYSQYCVDGDFKTGAEIREEFQLEFTDLGVEAAIVLLECDGHSVLPLYN